MNATDTLVTSNDRITIEALAQQYARVIAAQASLVKYANESGYNGSGYPGRAQALATAAANLQGANDLAARTGLLSRAGETVFRKVIQGITPNDEDYLTD